MKSNNPNLLHLLPYAGALPFIACACLVIARMDHLPMLGPIETIAQSYGLLILSFMAGVHWGQHVSGVRGQVNLLVSSNAVALAAWFGFLLLPAHWFYSLLIALFTGLYLIDRPLQADPDYLGVRRNVTLLVCLSLLVLAVA
jgi:Protein of unknown function (DUF3429)